MPTLLVSYYVPTFHGRGHFDRAGERLREITAKVAQSSAYLMRAGLGNRGRARSEKEATRIASRASGS